MVYRRGTEGQEPLGVETDVIFDSCHRSSLDVKILKINPQCIILHKAFKLRGKLCSRQTHSCWYGDTGLCLKYLKNNF